MKICVVGAGAMGSVYACFFAEAGHEVWAVDGWDAHVEAIRAHGLRLEGASGNRSVKSIEAVSDVRLAGECDLYVIATKAYHVEQAAMAMSSVVGAEGDVVTIQNGVGAADIAARILGAGRLFVGVADGFGASVIEPGRVHHAAFNLIRIGAMGGGLPDRVERMVKTWAGAGFRARAYKDIDRLIWEKLVCNVAFSGPCAVSGATLGELMADSAAWKTACGCAREAHAVGLAKGVRFSFDDPVEYATQFGLRMPGARPSMLLDHLARRRSEIDALNGTVVELGRKHGVAAPSNELILAAVRKIEESFESCN